VVFNMASGELELESSCPDAGSLQVGELQDHHDQLHTSAKLRRAVNFSDREELIMAQLAAVSAPERQHSESEDEELALEDEDAEEDEEAGEGMSDVQSDVDEDDTARSEDPGVEDLLCHDDEEPIEPPHSLKRVVHSDSYRQSSTRKSHALHDNQGVFLDFRTSETPGKPSERLLQRSRLIEVADAIDDDFQEAAKTSAGARSELVPFASQRPRSILKSSTPAVPESSTRRENTAANTRRNSRVEIELDDSRYFTNAADTLRAPDPSKHRIVPRRSSYFDNSRVEIAGSDRLVPQTSPEPQVYMDLGQLQVLRKTSKTGSASRSLRTSPQDLKVLTRSVSREHGTLAQSIRRRTSLPFQSPTKVH